jgi:hypothetical protein
MKTVFALAALAACGTVASAAVVTQWNFNSIVGDGSTSTGTTTPSIGAGTVANLAGVTNTFAAGGTGTVAPASSSDPNNTDDSGYNTTNYQANPTSGPATPENRGVRFSVDTTLFQDITVTFDWRTSNTSSDLLRVDYTTDGGTTWVAGPIFNSVGGDSWNQGLTLDLSAIPAADNNASFGFRFVQQVDAASGRFVPANAGSNYAATGTWRFDMVTINGTLIPTPGTAALAAIGGLLVARRRRA